MKTHACNPRYLRGGDRRNVIEASLGKVRPHLKNKIETKGLRTQLK
jgi:hypothetical protein